MVILLEVGALIGALPTIGLVIMTAVTGVWLLRLEGIATLQRVQDGAAALYVQVDCHARSRRKRLRNWKCDRCDLRHCSRLPAQ